MKPTNNNPPQLEFDENSHTYTLGDRTLVSVTQALHRVNLIETDWFTEDARIRGQWVHKAIELYLLGTLDLDTVPENIWPYLYAFMEFQDDMQFKPIERFGAPLVETRLVHDNDGFAGTTDLIGTIRDEKSPTVIDIKTSQSIQKWWALQLAAYSNLIWANHMKFQLGSMELCGMKRRVLMLRPSSTYKLVNCDAEIIPYQQALSLFYNALSIVHFMNRG